MDFFPLRRKGFLHKYLSFVYDCYLGLIVLATILFGTQQLFGSIINTMHVS